MWIDLTGSYSTFNLIKSSKKRQHSVLALKDPGKHCFTVGVMLDFPVWKKRD